MGGGVVVVVRNALVEWMVVIGIGIGGRAYHVDGRKGTGYHVESRKRYRRAGLGERKMFG